ncbi:MAG: penicillin-binding protein activator [Bacteriovoracaceae bacterium]|nr:penicillin-binding protein activator [Bacteriovoracaceae bacterium]
MRKVLGLLSITFLILLSSCGITMIKSGARSDLYTERFLVGLEEIKSKYRQGEPEVALKSLMEMPEEGLLVSEKAMRRNLVGVILFSKRDYEKAIFNFDLALSSSSLDEALTAQIYLNLSSSYFKLGFMEKAFSSISLADHTKLSKDEAKKHHKLSYNLAKELGRDKEVIKSLVLYLSSKKGLSELKNDPMFEHLLAGFVKLGKRDKVHLLETFEDEKPIVIGYLAYLEAEKTYYNGEKEEAKDFLEWIRKRFEGNDEISTLVDNFFFRVENFSKMNQLSIGVILPLSGQKKNYGERALLGIDSGLEEIKKNLPEGKNYTLHILDSEGSGAVGAYRVRDLVEKHSVGAIIGGLFSSEATKEYLEAKRNGVLFISLSQIYLPKDEKDHLLLEIPGSIESQVARVFSDEMLSVFGKNAAILYPHSARGEAYVSEFWRRAQQSGVSITGINDYEKNQTDYREPVRNLLGLKNTRARKEELELLSEIHSLEKRKSIRRIQTLKPILDFDWIFIPAYPKEALQIIPSFTYFDAFKLRMVGGPSWRSRMLSTHSSKLGKLFFVGDDVQPVSKNFIRKFHTKYNRRPRLIEIRAFDSISILNDIYKDKTFETRDELDINLRSQTEITGLTGSWYLDDSIWIKKMSSLMLNRGKISNLFSSDETSESQSQ